MSKRLRFSQIERDVPTTPGVYEIYFGAGIPLKVGIGRDLRRRLIQHRASRQSGLRPKRGCGFSKPEDVRSKASILAKHLYYDQHQSITSGCNLTTEEGRRDFLENQCYILICPTLTVQEARDIERRRQDLVDFRYVGRVAVRNS